MILYSIRALAEGYMIAKFDNDFDIEATYEVSPQACSCPAFHRRQSCKHQDILAKFIVRGNVDSEWFYCHETGGWHNPLGLESMPRVEAPPPSEDQQFLKGLTKGVVATITYYEDGRVVHEPIPYNELLAEPPPTSPPLSVPRQVSSEPFKRRI